MTATLEPHILFVEDNEATRYAVNRILRNAGYRVTTADRGERGLALAREARPDLVLLDARLPDLSGFEICRALKSAPATAGLPVVFLSASHVASGDKIRGLEGGADAYLTHPVDPHVLVATLHALLRVRLAEARHRRLVEANVIGVFEFGPDGAVTEANDEFLRIAGRDRAELGAIRWRDLAPPDLEPPLLRAADELSRAGAVRPFEAEIARPDGARTPVLAAGALLEGHPGHGVGLALDLSERRRAEREREEALARVEAGQRRMALLLKVTSALIAEPARISETLGRVAALCVPELADWCVADRVDAGGAVERAAVAAGPERAGAARVLSARAPQPGVGAPGLALARGELQLADHPHEVEVEPPRDAEHAGALAALGATAVVAVPLATRGQVLGALTFVRRGGAPGFSPVDLALAEEIAARVALALENARLYDELGTLLRAREDALAEVAHDLRTPLQAIVLGALAIERGGDGADPRRTAEAIRRSGERMSRLVADMLDLARIQAGRLALRAEPQDAAALVAEAVEGYVALAREKDLRLLQRSAPALSVRCDRERVAQVLANLLGNAVKFSPPGGVVEVGSVARGPDAVFWVRDEGPGIAPEDQAHVFERYWRARRAGGPGAGLGLSIAKGIVEAHGGKIWLTSAPGAGSTFYFGLPLPPAA